MEKLIIPTTVQELLDSINSTKLDLGEIKIDKHPLVSQDLDRYIQINKINNLKNGKINNTRSV